MMRATSSGNAARVVRSAVAAVAALACPPQARAEAQPEPPNVLLIVADDAEMQDLGSYGGDLATPHLDRLAAEGARFTHACPSATVCTPSRYSILTGQYASRANSLAERTPDGKPSNITWNTSIGPDDPAMGKVFSRLDYQTALVGKWHVGQPKQWHIPPRS